MRWWWVLMCCLSWATQAETFEAYVIAVIDGDTVLVLRDKQKLKLRLADIDAPEKVQPFGQRSLEFLKSRVNKKVVQVESRAIDQYGRTIATIKLDGIDLNQELVRQGMAWEYSFHHSNKDFIALQLEAQQARRGLWQQTSAQAPWDWRKQHPSYYRSHTTNSRPSVFEPYDLACGKKSRCAQMQSCDEAHFYLTRCRVTSLDKDGDGIPCPKLCISTQ
ncbi:MAG: thermonuclease family protein [Gammaproteobacteria bacterium]|nr:thermonuclease family protein [Gammaproteobacteria bacterium]MBU1623456.1 thermonuclease family protein [Gammaproteobacteria bacterium]MBU1982295.1 thermonuclease family protein [Gammaproteobacteria bacterium]